MNGSRYVGGILCVDVFSSKLYFQPILSKTAKTVATAYEKMMVLQNEDRYPATVRSDKVPFLSSGFYFNSFCCRVVSSSNSSPNS